ncbi:MAG: response regulator [Armatimonadetes bacterium]|nr:response regulator [Armatimonadota bacterium]
MTESVPTNRKAIICEDEALTSARLAQQLEELGYDVVARASDGLEAVEAAQAHHPELILMDIKMPGMDGLEAARRIRGEQPGAAIVVITAHVNDGFIDQAVEAGVEGYLVKPVSPEQLRVALSLALSNSRRRQEAQDEAEEARARLAERRTIERAKGILMDTQGLSENDAYRRLRKRSQDERRPMAELAEEVIRANSLPAEGESRPTP